jgi:hypothetical protein
MFLPVRHKPETTADYTNLITIVPNLITKDLADQLKTFAKNESISGWHRRGSKNPNIKASFYTCLVFHHNVPIYDILDEVWYNYIKENKSNLTFLEPYEIKLYVESDNFGYHNDILISEKYDVERKINLLIQLSDDTDYEGGDLYVGSTQCPRTFGTGIFFPAKYPHSVTEITKGERYSLIGHAWGPI